MKTFLSAVALSRKIFARLVKPRSIERRLLLWLLIITLVPSLTVLGVASWAGSRAAHLLGASGSWSGVAESGRTLIDEAERRGDAPLREAADEHRAQLTESLTQASRWEFIGQRMRASLPLFFIGLAIMVAVIAILAARRMSRSLTRPIRELVEWSGKMAREETLPEPTRRESGEVKELQALRGALRNASEEMRSARARALETERTRSWGEMARRVAHEMKNPLTPLRLASHRLAAVAVERPELAEPISVIAEETRRLEELASRFALLGRPADGPRAHIDLADLLQRLLSSDVPDDADARLDVDSAYPYTLADYNALMQVFRNLVRNSLEATPAGARPVLRLRIADDASWLKVTLADQGRGFGDYAPDDVFEPDFTSKAHGTGLGLAIARQIIRAHGGDISAQPGAKGGAQFIVKLQRSIEEDGVT